MLTPEDVVNRIWEKVEEIKKKIPPRMAMEIKGYVVPRKYYDALMRNRDFREMAQKGRANLGAYPVRVLEDAEDVAVDYEFRQIGQGVKRNEEIEPKTV